MDKRFRLRYPWLRFADGGGSGGDGGNNGGGGAGQVFSAEYVKDLRNEAADYRTKLRAAEQARDEAVNKLKSIDDGTNALLGRARELLKLDAKADLSAVTQKLSEVVGSSDAVMKRAQEALRKAAFVSAATKANVIDIDAAYKLADLGSVAVDMETSNVYPVDKDGKQLMKDGKPVGLESVIETLVKDKPYLAGKVQTANVGGASNPGGGQGGDQDWSKAKREDFASELAKFGLRPGG